MMRMKDTFKWSAFLNSKIVKECLSCFFVVYLLF